MSTHKPPVPYIGITGIVKPTESAVIAQTVPGYSTRKTMIGVLVSSKTLRGQPNQWPNRYAKTCDLPGIFTDQPATFNVIHYNAHEPNTLLDQLLAVRRLAGPNLHGFQLNMAWPSPGDLSLFTRQNPDQQLIIQLNQEAFQMTGNIKSGII